MKNIIICDIDGTIADLSHRLHYIKRPDGQPKDWASFHAAVYQDTVHRDIREILYALMEFPHKEVIYVSGRMESSYGSTYFWLLDHGFPQGRICMRAEGDFRPDYIIKEEILDRDLELTPDDVLCVLEDRDQVVQMWRRRGFRVLQVANGDF